MSEELRKAKKVILDGIIKILKEDDGSLTSADYAVFGNIAMYFDNYEITKRKLEIEELRIKLEDERNRESNEKLYSYFDKIKETSNKVAYSETKPKDKKPEEII